MVRIIPVFNFLSQNVGQIEESTASCTANVLDQDMLLLALSSHCVKVYALTTIQLKLITTFPTVDLVHELLHSDKGNYVVTLESKLSRDGMSTNNFVRIYINWAMVGNQYQPMRARIAGRVTPSLNRSQSNLEMIELPLSEQPTNIACCQSTGNLLVIMGHKGMIYELKVQTQQTTKHKFIDFVSLPWLLNFTFIPSRIGLAEDFIYIMNSTNFALIRLSNRFQNNFNYVDNFDDAEKINNTKNCHHLNENNLRINLIANDKNNEKQRHKGNIVFTKAINRRSYIDWNELKVNEVTQMEQLKSQNLVDTQLNKISILLPSIKQGDQAHKHQFLDLSIINAPEINVSIIESEPNENRWYEDYIVEHLLRLKIADSARSTVQNVNFEYFTCAVMNPSYARQKFTMSNSKDSLLHSRIHNIFNGITCLISTTQEGYLYFFSATNKEETSDIHNCQIYPFTATVSQVVLENTVLHAFTKAGLETYTLRVPHCNPKPVIQHNEHIDDVYETDPVSLIGLRPFLGVQKMLLAAKSIVLLASDENTWTFYSLTLPQPEDIYHDILDVANNHKFSSPTTYRHLLNEAHTILRLSTDMIYYTSNALFFQDISDISISHLHNLYRQSCALLADYYISSESPSDWYMSTSFYKRAGLKPYDVLNRKYICFAPGLVTFLSKSILNIQTGPEADALFQKHNIVEMLMKAEKKDLLELILMSPVLREYATDKLINILLQWHFNDMTRLSLVLLYTQADRQCQADKFLEPITDHFIIEKTLDNWSWLFDVSSQHKDNAIPTFSDFSATLMRQKVMAFSQILTLIVERDAVSLNQIIQIFLAYLPSRVGRDGRIVAIALQLFLEKYLQNFFNISSLDCLRNGGTENVGVIEGLKILVRSYLAELAQTKSERIVEIPDNENNTSILFENSRPSFLNYPPLYKKDEQMNMAENLNEVEIVKEESNNNQKSIRLEIRKLQALLASGVLPSECFQEVEHFLNTQNIEGSLSFRILCVTTTEKGIHLLAEECPRALFQYAKNKYTTEIEWKYFVRFLVKKMSDSTCTQEMHTIYDELLKDSAIYVAQTLSMSGSQRVLSNDILPDCQQYIDISNQVIHADYIKAMIVGTGQHLLWNTNF